MLSKLFLLFIYLVLIKPEPIIVKSGISEDHNQEQDEKKYDGHNIKAVSNFEENAGFNKGNHEQVVKAADQGNYQEDKGEKHLHNDQNNFAKDKYHTDHGGHVYDVNRKAGHKKGQHKSGFTKSYRKDETESNASYYDDNDDEGGQYLRNSKKGNYGDVAQQNLQGHHLDNSQYHQDQNRRGYYGNAGNLEEGLGKHQTYHDRKLYDQGEKVLRRGDANRFAEDGRFIQDHYVRESYYRPRPKITIYEDPRYVHDYQRFQRQPYYDEHTQLEFRSPPRNYLHNRFYRRPYDYYY